MFQFVAILFLFLVLTPNITLGQNEDSTNSEFPNCSATILLENLDYPTSTNIDNLLIENNRDYTEFEQMYCYAKQTKNIKMEALSLYIMAKFLLLRSDVYSVKKILVYIEKSIVLCEENDFFEIYMVAKEIQCTLFTNYGFLDNAEIYGNDLLQTAIKRNDSTNIAEGHMLLGRIKREQGEFKLSEEHLNKALSYSKVGSDTSQRTLCFTYLHLSYLRRQQEKYHEAIEYAQEGLNSLRGTPYDELFRFLMTVAIITNNIDLGIYENNIALLESVRETAPKYNYITSEFHYVYGLQLEMEGKYEKAIASYLECIGLSSRGLGFSMISQAYERIIPLLEMNEEMSNPLLEIVEHSQAVFKEEVLKHKAENQFKAAYLQLQDEKEKAAILTSKFDLFRKLDVLAFFTIVVFGMLTFSIRSRLKLKKRLNSNITSLNMQLKDTVQKLTVISEDLEFSNMNLEKLTKKQNKVIKRLEKFNEFLTNNLKFQAITIASSGETLKSSDNTNIFNPKEKKFLDSIVVSSNRFLKMINSLYRYNNNTLRIASEFKPVDLNEILEMVVNDLYSLINKTITQIVLGKLPKVLGEKILLYQLFLNLVSNAIKYQKVGIAPFIEITCRIEESLAIIQIKDNGRGISTKDGDHIFESMQRGSNVIDIHGKGLGLAICKDIVDVLSAQIYFTSKVGIGTTFYVEFSTDFH